jgi:hypothetical protein
MRFPNMGRCLLGIKSPTPDGAGQRFWGPTAYRQVNRNYSFAMSPSTLFAATALIPGASRNVLVPA